MELFLKIAIAAVLGFMLWRLWPVANHWLKHGPRGSSEDWRAALLPLALVAGFVALLVFLVRG